MVELVIIIRLAKTVPHGPRPIITSPVSANGRHLALITAFICLPLVLSCGGSAPQQGSRAAPLVGGQPTTPDMFQAVGAIFRPVDRAYQLRCTGSLIGPDLVITAAHCVDQIPPQLDGWGFALGHDLRGDIEPAAMVPLASVALHPDWDPQTNEAPDGLVEFHDIAAFVLARPLGDVSPIAVSNAEQADEALRVGADVTVVGLGRQDPAEVDSVGLKRHGTSRIVAVGPYEFRIDAPQAAQKCVGDSGSPTLIDLAPGADHDWRLVGLASRSGAACDDGSTETRLDAHLDWIHQLAELPCGSGLSSPCGPADTEPHAPTHSGCQLSDAIAPIRTPWLLFVVGLMPLRRYNGRKGVRRR